MGTTLHCFAAGRMTLRCSALLIITDSPPATLLAREGFSQSAMVGAAFSTGGPFVLISIPSPVWAGAGVRGETVSVTDAIDPADCDCAKYLISGCSRHLFLKRSALAGQGGAQTGADSGRSAGS
jgi:hypothetical protein